ncbi:VOC family protein [Cyclobacterium jeungdonense]|uniref:VOC family protein n=1 Tax=Cyclobacterium jeungdonense TaxID=708087 RepID=A0ABT8C6K5_9BACT|nr:VOC family protein [Cyclobacterium jeungdonense]MDN3687659.1 VOC family protein [Cyclobacterium jeungdonense]
MKTINPYLGFDGNCREAMTFYQTCFGGALTFQTIGESPMASQCPTGKEGHILHSSLTGDNFLFMATDMTPPDGFKSGSEVSLAISFDSESDIRKVYELLSKQGNVLDDLKESLWGSLFGVVQDRFGKVWMLDFEKKQP